MTSNIRLVRSSSKKPLLKYEFEVGQIVKICFYDSDGEGERMWVEVTGKGVGILRNEPNLVPDLHFGDVVEFDPKKVLDVFGH